jgi:ribosomal protein S18 acetylase RimI-like enzyme
LDYTIRLATPADVEAIRALTREAYARWVPVVGREPLPMTADYEAAVRAHRFDLLYVDGALAGLIETVDEGEQLLIENVAVAPAFQGQGLGRRLLAHAEAIAREAGRSRVRLYTSALMAANIELYQRLGYAIDGREVTLEGRNAVHMSKAVAAAS